MPTPVLITDLSTTAASNFPAGSDSPASLDDVQRAHAAFIAQIRDGAVAVAGTGLTGTAAALSIGGNAATATNATNATNVTGTIASAVTATTQTAGDSSTKVATTAFVLANTPSQIQPITASVSANALTVTLNPTKLDFRSATLTSGTVNTRQVGTAISLTISSGSTLGTVSAQQSRIAVLAIDNAGTVELAAVNLAGGNDLSETGLITTTAEGGAGGADTANVIYSATARASVPYRVVGYVESTQATAGTWATTPSTIQGTGGQALAAMSSLGYGQTWQSLTGSRALGVTYYNTTGKPISVSIGVSGSIAPATLTVGTTASYAQPGTATISTLFAIVPPGGSYICTYAGSLTQWSELR